MEFGEVPGDLQRLILDKLQALSAPPKPKKEVPVGFMTDEEVRDWNAMESVRKECQRIHDSLHEKIHLLEAHRKAFWGRIEVTRNLADKTMRIDSDTLQIIMIEEVEENSVKP